ncbi:MAG: tripartite tricarboxylate transporter substrate binding protein [Burkholderiales bacterium]|nr:tripartite tricarboxylate transporter substrate binding protein [Burkholderiales bacterium]
MKALIASLCLVIASGWAIAQTRGFPDRSLRIIVHVGAGSGSDAASRFVAERLARTLGQPVIVENKPGAGGNIAVMAVRSAPADGYTLLMTSISTLSVNPIVMKDLPYDPVKDFKPISGLIRTTSAIVVSPNSPYRSLQDLVTAGRKATQPLQFAHYAPGYRLAVEWLADLSGMKVSQVPYKGASAMLPDVMEGRVDFAITDLGGVEQLAKGGKLRLLAVSSEKRVAEFPEVPTVAESGFAEWINYPWTALHVRSETPDEVTAILVEAMRKVMALPEVEEYARKTPGTALMPYGPAELRSYHTTELQRFRALATKVGIRPE